MQCNAMQCNAMQYNTIQYNTIQYNTIQYNTIQYNTIQYNTIQYNTIQYNIISNNTYHYKYIPAITILDRIVRHRLQRPHLIMYTWLNEELQHSFFEKPLDALKRG